MPLVRAAPAEFVYLDYNATTPVDPRVAERIQQVMLQDFGNPSSDDHVFGNIAIQIVESARLEIRELIGAGNHDVVFTSGATESINLGLAGLADVCRSMDRPFRVAVNPTEHSAVLQTLRALSRRRLAELVFLRVNERAQLDLEHLADVLAADIDLVCVMAANNEVGVTLPVQEVGQLCREYGALFFCDVTQAAGKIPLAVDEWDVTMAALSAHKMYGPKGVGALVRPRDLRLSPLLFGGNQESGLRPGTLNVPGIAGFGEAARLRRSEMAEDESRIAGFRDRMQARLLDAIPELVVHANGQRRLAGTLSISIPGAPNKAVVARVRERLGISTGAACSSGLEQPSHVLRAMGVGADVAETYLRISVGKFSTMAEVETATQLLVRAVAEVREKTTLSHSPLNR